MSGHRYSNKQVGKTSCIALLLGGSFAFAVCNVDRWTPLRGLACKGDAAEAKHGVKKKVDSAGQVTLYGQVDELSYMCSAAGLQLKGQGPPYEVAKISLG